MTTPATLADTLTGLPEPTQIWEFGDWIVAKYSENWYAVLGPEAPTDEPFWFVAALGLAGWECDFTSVGDVLVTQLHRPQ